MTSDRITRANVDARLSNLNDRFAARGSVFRYAVQSHSGSTHLYRERLDGTRVDHITAGTKSEIAAHLHAAMVALDDAAVTS